MQSRSAKIYAFYINDKNNINPKNISCFVSEPLLEMFLTAKWENTSTIITVNDKMIMCTYVCLYVEFNPS
jgi:hypothetical protein